MTYYHLKVVKVGAVWDYVPFTHLLETSRVVPSQLF